MAERKVSFTVTPSSGSVRYWIAVGNDDITLVNGKGSINLETGRKHILTWWMAGNNGDSISITGKDDQDKKVVEVKESKIPAGENEGAGIRRFQM